METARGTAGLAQAAASNAQMRMGEAPTFRGSMLAFQLESLFLLTILINRQATARASRTHSRMAKASPYPSRAIRRHASSISESIFA